MIKPKFKKNRQISSIHVSNRLAKKFTRLVGFLKTEVTFIFSFGRFVAKIWLNVPVDR